jgi:hypothetical protein
VIIAIGRELCAGGRLLGETVARLAGAELLDHQIVDLVAARIGAPSSYVKARDEAVESFAERLFRVITAAYPEAYAAGTLPDWSEERLVQLTATIIREHAGAGRGPLVVIGRGAPVLLRGRRDTLRVFVTAPLESRVQTMRDRTGCTAEEAMREMKRSDQQRQAYMAQHYGVNWRDPALYDLVVNTGRVGVEVWASLVLDAARHLESDT